jgi:hypothetical protein
MLRQSPHRLLVAFICCALCLTVGTIPAAAQPGLDSASAIRFEIESVLARLWRLAGEPVAALFAADGTVPPPPTAPPTTDSGVCIDPNGTPGPAPCIDRM